MCKLSSQHSQYAIILKYGFPKFEVIAFLHILSYSSFVTLYICNILLADVRILLDLTETSKKPTDTSRKN